MNIVNPQLISGKKILLRLDVDVPIENGKVVEDFRLRAGISTLKLCFKNASKVIAIGHLGRPAGVDSAFSLDPVREWHRQNGFPQIELLENLRFDPGEETCSLNYAKELAGLGEVFVNEAFAAYRPSASTTILPTLLPHCAGLRFAKEVEKLTEIREHPQKPFIAIMGGAKVTDKLPVITVLARSADAVLVGGKLISEIREQNLGLPKNVMVGMLNEDGLDIASQTIDAWGDLISKAKMIVWNGPVGKFEDPKNDATKKLARMILDSSAEIVIGGGDSVAALSQYGLFTEAEKKAFVSTGGGAMLKFLTEGTLQTVENLQ